VIFFGNLSMVIRAGPIIPHLLASGGVATNVSRGGSGWWGCRSLPFGRSRGLPASKPAPGPREPCDASWIDGSREEDARTIVRPRQSFPTCAGEVAPVASISRTAPGCGAGRKSLYLPTTGVDRCPAPPPELAGALSGEGPGHRMRGHDLGAPIELGAMCAALVGRNPPCGLSVSENALSS